MGRGRCSNLCLLAEVRRARVVCERSLLPLSPVVLFPGFPFFLVFLSFLCSLSFLPSHSFLPFSLFCIHFLSCLFPLSCLPLFPVFLIPLFPFAPVFLPSPVPSFFSPFPPFPVPPATWRGTEAGRTPCCCFSPSLPLQVHLLLQSLSQVHRGRERERQRRDRD